MFVLRSIFLFWNKNQRNAQKKRAKQILLSIQFILILLFETNIFCEKRNSFFLQLSDSAHPLAAVRFQFEFV